MFNVAKTDSRGDWIENNERWFHKSGRFFSVIKDWDRNGPILEQLEIGCLGLVITRHPDTQKILVVLSKKTEPGSVVDPEYTTTIQATRSNIEGAHGGRSVPHLDFFLERTELLHCSIQLEQTDAYTQKANANIIKFAEYNTIPDCDSLIMVTLDELAELALTDTLNVSMDTRSVGSLLFSKLFFTKEPFKCTKRDKEAYWLFRKATKITDLKNYKYEGSITCNNTNKRFVKNRHKKFKYDLFFYEINIANRENSQWIQPLLTRESTREFILKYTTINGEKHIFVDRGQTETGEWNFWCSSPVKPNCTYTPKAYATYAEEGGRFYQVCNEYSIVAQDTVSDLNRVEVAKFTQESLLYGMSTSVELRSLLFLMYSKDVVSGEIHVY